MRPFADVHADLHACASALAGLSVLSSPADLTEEQVTLVRDLARLSSEALVTHGDTREFVEGPSPWLRFALQFDHASGSDGDTVSVAFDGLERSVINVDGTPIVFLRVEQDEDGSCYLVGLPWSAGDDRDFLPDPVRLPLQAATVTVY
jgi:hypothetical protein